jgi:hypothetical protein
VSIAASEARRIDVLVALAAHLDRPLISVSDLSAAAGGAATPRRSDIDGSMEGRSRSM